MKLMARPTALIAGAAIAVAVAAPGWAQDTDADAPTADAPASEAGAQDGTEPTRFVDVDAGTVMATVNGEVVTLGHVIAAKNTLPQQYQALPNDVLLQALVDQLIQQTVLGQAMGEMTRRAQIQLDNERRAITATEKLDEIIAGAVDEDAVQAAYDATYSSAEPMQEWNASHILVETEDDAQALVEELKGGADFAELAKEKSTGPSGPNGGELGWFSPGMMVKPFEDAVAKMQVDEIAGPIETQFGWHVIKLNDARMKGAPALDEVRDDIVSQLQNDAVELALSTLLDAATVERTDISVIDPNVLSDPEILN